LIPNRAVLGFLGAALLVAPAQAQEELRGVLAVRGETTIAQENAERLFVPASVQKLVVAAAALHYLGPDHRIVTELRMTGSLEPSSDGLHLDGDLVLVGAGDPTWNRRHRGGDARAALRELAGAVAARGIRTVSGSLVLDTSAFPGRRVPLDWSVGDTSFAYGAGPSALALDENVLTVTARAGGLWGPAVLAGSGEYEWMNRSTTVPSHRHGRGTLDFQPIWGTRTIVVRGEFPITEPIFGVRLAAPDAVERVGAELLGMLADRGVAVAGGVLVSSERRPMASDPIASSVSPPLREILPAILEDSNNWYAEMLLRHLALAETGEGRMDHGLDLAATFLERTVGNSRRSFVLDDGSGLSPYNLLSPRAVVDLLRWSWAQPWRQVLVEALASAGEGTLAGWGTLPPVLAKTGTLRHTQSLAGVLDPTAADPVFFAVFLNHATRPQGQLKRDIGNLLWRWQRTRSEATAQTTASAGR
jgi:D-alanyl-D-alanine carboxypeptidase/D-alanyl-D-alanine-endopeptidase (penicillin-binding protein 4)